MGRKKRRDGMFKDNVKPNVVSHCVIRDLNQNLLVANLRITPITIQTVQSIGGFLKKVRMGKVNAVGLNSMYVYASIYVCICVHLYVCIKLSHISRMLEVDEKNETSHI